MNTKTSQTDTKASSSSKDKYDPKNEKLIFDADMAGMEVKDWIEVQKMKDEKLNRIEEIRSGK